MEGGQAGSKGWNERLYTLSGLDLISVDTIWWPSGRAHARHSGHRAVVDIIIAAAHFSRLRRRFPYKQSLLASSRDVALITWYDKEWRFGDTKVIAYTMHQACKKMFIRMHLGVSLIPPIQHCVLPSSSSSTYTYRRRREKKDKRKKLFATGNKLYRSMSSRSILHYFVSWAHCFPGL